MAITVNGQILRNLPEQVSKNTEDILDLQDTTNLQGDKIAALENSIITDITLNNLEVTGNTVIGNAGSDTLTVTGSSSFNGSVSTTGSVTVGGALAGASASFTGNVSVSGNLSVSGEVSTAQGANLNDVYKTLSGRAEVNGFYALDQDLNLSLYSGVSGVNITYQHVRVSNEKLNIVIGGYYNNLEAPSAVIANPNDNEVSLPAWVAAKLKPLYQPLETWGLVARQHIKAIHSSNDIATQSWTEGETLACVIYKNGNNIRIGIAANSSTSISDNQNYEFRFEFNFIL